MASLMSFVPMLSYAQFSSMTSLEKHLQEEATTLFVRKDYAAARQALIQMIKEEQPNASQEYIDYILSQTAFRLKLPERLDLLNRFIDDYPASLYVNATVATIGAVYYEQGKYEEAIVYLQTADLNAIADGSEMLYYLADANFEIKRYKDARAWFTVLKSEPNYSHKAIYHIAYIDYLESRLDDAIAGMDLVKNVKEYEELAPFYIADSYRVKGDFERAGEIALKFLNEHPKAEIAPEMFKIAGMVEYSRQQYSPAIRYFEQYRETVKTQPAREVLYQLGMSYLNTGVYSKAEELLGQVTITEDRLSQNAYYNMGIAALALKKHSQARMAFEQAAASNYDDKIREEALYNYALCLHETAYSPFAESVHVFERFLNTYPQSVYADKVNSYLVDVYMNTKNYNVALASIAKIKSPGRRILQAKQQLLFNLGAQYFAQGNLGEAKQAYTQAINVGNVGTDILSKAYYWRGETNYRLQDLQSAVADFGTYLSQSASSSSLRRKAYYGLGYIQFNQKNYQAATSNFEQVIKGNVGNDIRLVADAYNRLGDCYLERRSFDQAVMEYNKARQTDTNVGDYSLLQTSLIKGLQRQFTNKIEVLNQIISNYPDSPYLDDVIYEQARAFVQMDDTPKAIERYNTLTTKYPESNYSQKAAIELALLYYQSDKYDAAISAYKHVIATYPGSEEARMAQRDLRSLYVETNRVNEYLSYMESLPGEVKFDENEKDVLVYNAAETAYMKGNINSAKQGFENYISSFQNGAYRVNAAYYLGLIAYNQKEREKALTYFDKVLEYPNSKFAVKVLPLVASMTYELKDYSKALKYYKEWANKADGADKVQALEGAMKSANMLGDAGTAILFADAIKNQQNVSPQTLNEAIYIKAKALMASKDAKNALPEFQLLAKDTRTVYGAEAKYQVAQIYFERGDLKSAEKELLNFIDQSTPHAYWLARGFVLLSDVYAKQGKKILARQYLLSLKSNYQEKDNIAEMIETRLSKLK